MKRLIWAFLLLFCSSLSLAEHKDDADKDASQFTYDYLFLVEALIRHERYPEARKELDGLLQRVEEKYEKALVHQTYGYVSIGLDDYPGAIGHFQQAIKSGALPAEVNHNLRYTTAQLLLQEGKNQAALNLLKRWFADEEKPSLEARVLLAQIHYSLRQWKPAIHQMELVIKQSPKPHESWYQLLVGLYLETNQLKPAAKLLKKMVRLFPDRVSYWQQLSGVLLQLRREKEASAVMTLAADKGLLKTTELIRLARLFLHQNMPLNAAELLSEKIEVGEVDRNVKHLNLLVDAWLLSREPDKALAVLDELAKLDRSGRPDLRAGALLLEQERWQEAVDRLQRGLKSSKKPAARDWLLLGTAQIRLDDKEAAITTFTQALEQAKTKQDKQQAQRWLEYLNAR